VYVVRDKATNEMVWHITNISPINWRNIMEKKKENTVKTNEVADSIAYLAEQFQGDDTNERIASTNIVNALDEIAHSLWDGSRANGFDDTIPDALFAVSRSLDKIAEAISAHPYGKGS
jgi:hypothetical protein